MRKGLSHFNMVSVALGLSFLYLPIAILVIFSFNNVASVAAWGGWSTRWYAMLLEDGALQDAAVASFGIAASSAAAATVIAWAAQN